MGNCDSSSENNHLKYISNREKTKESTQASMSLSSNSLLQISPNYLNQKEDNYLLLKKHHSNPLENKLYFLPESIAKREDITKKYKISNICLGDGATSLVFLAENFRGEKFAIKKIQKEKIVKKKEVAIKEAEICLKFHNENIIKYYEIFEDINYIYIVMELGVTDLFEIIVNSPYGRIYEDVAIDFMIQIFEAIDYLHNVENIVHCDIKPENFIVKYDKEKIKLKLADFGNIRKKPNDKERLYYFSGTREYMAPETLENYGFNEKIDEWAAGIIMYNMLTGCDPFSAETDSDYKDKIKFKDIKFEYIKNESLRELNKKLLNRYIAKRITAKEALEEIKAIKQNMKKNNNYNVKENMKKIRNYWNNISNKLINIA